MIDQTAHQVAALLDDIEVTPVVAVTDDLGLEELNAGVGMTEVGASVGYEYCCSCCPCCCCCA